MAKKFTKIVTLLMIFTVMFAFAGCDEKAKVGDNNKQTESQTKATDPSSVDNAENTKNLDETMDIMSSIGDQVYGVLPDEVDYEFIKDSGTSMTLYLKTAVASDLGGKVGSVMAFADGDMSYENFPDYHVAGTKGGYTYVVSLATDVQYDPDDEQMTLDYNKLTDALKSFTL